MKIICNDCQWSFTSVILEAPQAAMEVGEKLMAHYMEKHKQKLTEVFTEASVVNSVVNWIWLMQGCTSFMDARIKRQLKLQRETVIRQVSPQTTKVEDEG